MSFPHSDVVRVRAVVMTRDDSSGGWVPLGGPGLSHVVIRRIPHSDESGQLRFLIQGERIRDQTIILECGLKKDLVYNKVNPIFHHWKVDDLKFGLTFQSPADAISFETSIKSSIEELLEGSLSSSSSAHSEAGAPEDLTATLTDSESSANSQKEMLPKHVTIVTSQSSSSCYIWSPASDHFRLGVTPGTAHPNQSTPSPPSPNPPTPSPPTPHPSPKYPVQSQPLQGSSSRAEDEGENARPCRDPGPAKGYEDYRRAALGGREAGKVDLRVHFAKGEGQAAGSPRSECPLKEAKGSPACHIDTVPVSVLKKGNGGGGGGGGGGPSAVGDEDAAPSRCIYCRDVFQDNGPGRCRDAPDPADRCVRQLSCMWCAESMLYHCMSDSEGDYSDPCTCEAGSRHHLCARWLALLALSTVAPCMCCYLPLRACHHCGQRWGCCGGKHKAVR
ncbi:sprouty-related, EVH1 domain-containing protein 3 [Hemiscyllium ocellatum]|uniref:sprouty-related, EVH1 domain-containing protein 3 n=1 Tax=Hemiscyllium ocellatum TaxID=170820 RepID=UPI0029661C61|nr:sprouty-related, EVH1 domain-containing protein 3 [Hemiscyllium ocellatum]